jgi:Fe2+ or Zn2+ uptake regulation protein
VGEARKVTRLHDSARYDGHVGPHHHVVCVRCRLIRDIEIPEMDRFLDGRSSLGEFALLGCALEIDGLASAVRSNAPRKRRAPRARQSECRADL